MGSIWLDIAIFITKWENWMFIIEQIFKKRLEYPVLKYVFLRLDLFSGFPARDGYTWYTKVRQHFFTWWFSVSSELFEIFKCQRFIFYATIACYFLWASCRFLKDLLLRRVEYIPRKCWFWWAHVNCYVVWVWIYTGCCNRNAIKIEKNPSKFLIV